MKKALPFFAFLFLLFSCKKHNSTVSAGPGKWTALANFPGVATTGWAGFSIGNRLYAGVGSPGSNNRTPKDFYQFDPASGWSAIASFPLSGTISYSLGFSIGGLGYVVMTPDSVTKAGTLYAYDTTTNTWNARSPYPGELVQDATAFVINGKAYVGLGTYAGGIYNELYQYDPGTDKWTRMKDYPDVHTAWAASFVIGGYAYVGTGGSGSEIAECTANFYRYDPATDTWTPRASFPGGPRFLAAAFAIGNLGFVATGANAQGQNVADCWQYDPGSDHWTRKADFPGGATEETLGFSGATAGYMLFDSGNTPTANALWEFQP